MTTTAHHARHDADLPAPRPGPTAVTGPLIGFAFLGAILGAIRLAKGPFPRPGAPVIDIRRYYQDNARAARFSAAGQAVSILSLTSFVRSVAQLAADSHTRTGARTLRTTALASGGAAVASLTVAAGTHAALTLPVQRDDQTTGAMARRVFVAGGPIHGVAYGVFTGALTIIGHRAGRLGPAAVAIGLTSAAAGVASPLYFRWENAGWLIPIGRFSGYALSGIAGVRMARQATGQS